MAAVLVAGVVGCDADGAPSYPACYAIQAEPFPSEDAGEATVHPDFLALGWDPFEDDLGMSEGHRSGVLRDRRTGRYVRAPWLPNEDLSVVDVGIGGLGGLVADFPIRGPSPYRGRLGYWTDHEASGEVQAWFDPMECPAGIDSILSALASRRFTFVPADSLPPEAWPPTIIDR